MPNWLRAVMPREEKFLPLFDQHAEIVERGAVALRKLLLSDEPDAAELNGIAAEGERAAGDILQRLRASFVTPFGRGQIKEMVVTLQAALDDMTAAARARRLKAPQPVNEAMRDMGEIIVACAGEVRQGVQLLDKVDRHIDPLHAMRERVAAHRARMLALRDDALLALFGLAGQEPAATLAGLTVLERVSAVAERYDDAADRIDDLVLDHV
jgi:uncharacterized protein